MKEKKNVKLGIIGLGVVGSSLVSLILKNATRIALETGVAIEIEKIYVRDISKKRDVNISGLSLTSNIDDIINNPTIDIICECIGGNGCNYCGELGFYGQGAGGMPTASAMFNDLVNILGDKEPEISFPYEKMSNDEMVATASKYYFRFIAEDPEEVLSIVKNIFENNGMEVEKHFKKIDEQGKTNILFFIKDSLLKGIDETCEKLIEKGIKHEVMMGVM